MAAPAAVALKATRLCRQMLSFCSVRRRFLSTKHCRHSSFLVPRWKRLCDRPWMFSHFSTCACDIGWPRRDDDLSKGPIMDHTRRKPAHKWAGDACAVRETARREHIKKKSDNSQSRASAVHLWSWRRGRDPTISGC